MTGFAPDTIAKLETRTFFGCLRGVAAQTLLRRCGVLDAKALGNGDAARFAQYAKSAAMRAAGGGFLLPAHQLVLTDNLAVRFLASVTCGSAARGNAHVGARGQILRGFYRGRRRNRGYEESDSGERTAK